MQTFEQNAQPNRELMGVAFDHGQFPKIVAVHTMKQDKAVPKYSENTSYQSTTEKPEDVYRIGDAFHRVTPPIPAYHMQYNGQAMPQNFGYGQAQEEYRPISNPLLNYNAPFFSDSPPYHYAPHNGVANLHDQLRASHFPYERNPVNAQPVSIPRQHTSLSYQDTVHSQYPYSNALSKLNYYKNCTEAVAVSCDDVSKIHSSIQKSHPRKPYQRMKTTDNSYLELLDIENKYELLHLLKLGADNSRLKLSSIILKLLKGSYLENSLCLLERVKFSDLTERTKEKIVSVVDEIIWKAPPRDDFWQRIECGPMDENANYDDDIEFEKQQQQYLEELLAQQSGADDTDSSKLK